MNKTFDQKNKTEHPKNETTPFIRWIGGKRHLASKLLELLPKFDNGKKDDNIERPVSKPNYFESFLGGGTLYFTIQSKFENKFNKCYLSDVNLDLITSYQAVKAQPYKVIQYYNELYKNHSKEFYLKLRENPISNDPIHISARFLYINRYSFKGIYRINAKDELSASFSTRNYNNSNFNSRIISASKLLKSARISAGDFSFIEPKKGDFVYMDPPYHKSGEGFYTRLPFDETEQIRLRDFAKDLTKMGVNVMLSNSNTDFIKRIYKDFNITKINSYYHSREKNRDATELVIRNY